MQEKAKQKSRVLRNKGITLIALVITIIVLLILAGVTIATLTGDNGILTQASKAKDKTTEADAIERVQVEVLGSYGTDGTIDKDQLNKNLGNIEGLMLGETKFGEDNIIESLPATVTLNGYDIVINANGGVEKIPEIVAGIIANTKAYYGKKVTNYKASDSDTNTYRIFYIDKENYFGDGANTIYLKADFSSTNYSLINYASYDSANTKIRTMNPEWATGKTSDTDTKTRGKSEFKDPNAETKEVTWNPNEQAAAWLCSPVNETTYTTTTLPWKGYYNSSAANYVIGGPSIEMYVKSYNQAYSGETDVYTLGATYRFTNTPGYIYTLNGAQSTISNSDYYTGDNSLNYTRYNSMYCGKTENGTASKAGWWWLASPSADDPNFVCHMNGNIAHLGNSNYNSSTGRGISPLVSLKSSFIPEVEE